MAKFFIDLEKNGYAYQSDEGSWYFSISKKKKGYGTRLVQLDPEQLKKGAAVALNEAAWMPMNTMRRRRGTRFLFVESMLAFVV